MRIPWLVLILSNVGYTVNSSFKYFTQREFVFWKKKMKIFQILEKHYAFVGISSSKQSPQKYPINGKNLACFLLLGYTISFQFVYTFQVANGFMEYIDCISAISSNIILCICLVTMFSEKTLLFESVEQIEKLIDISELHFQVIYSCFQGYMNFFRLNFEPDEKVMKIQIVIFRNSSSQFTVQILLFLFALNTSTFYFPSHIRWTIFAWRKSCLENIWEHCLIKNEYKNASHLVLLRFNEIFFIFYSRRSSLMLPVFTE